MPLWPAGQRLCGPLANAFVAKALLGITRTAGLIEALTVDRALRRICGFSMCKKLPSEATFSRAFEEFSDARLPERVHARAHQDASGRPARRALEP